MDWPVTCAFESTEAAGRPVRIGWFGPVADVAELFSALDVPAVWAHIPGGAPNSAADLAARLAKSPIPGGSRQAVTVRWGHEVVGTSSFVFDPSDPSGVEIGGTYFASMAWGTGVNAAVKRAMIQTAFRHGAEWVQFRTDERNGRSAAAIRKLPGVVPTGLRREPTIVRPDGTVRKSLMFRVFRRSLPEVERELRLREPLFHNRSLGTTRADFLAQTADDFWEVGASGFRYDREDVWAVLERRFATEDDEPWHLDEFHVRRVGEAVFLATYRLVQDEVRTTRRATLWERQRNLWRALYHQGTLAD